MISENGVRVKRSLWVWAPIGMFGVVWGGELFLLWSRWINGESWWYRLPGAPSGMVSDDVSRMLLDAVLMTSVTAVVLVGIGATAMLRKRQAAWAITWTSIALGVVLLLAAAIVNSNVNQLDQQGCPALNTALGPNGGEGGSYAPRGWSWTEFGIVVYAQPLHGKVTRVVCR